jgi:hypothetical protein
VKYKYGKNLDVNIVMKEFPADKQKHKHQVVSEERLITRRPDFDITTRKPMKHLA